MLIVASSKTGYLVIVKMSCDRKIILSQRDSGFSIETISGIGSVELELTEFKAL